jgi:hypothetical protein
MFWIWKAKANEKERNLKTMIDTAELSCKTLLATELSANQSPSTFAPILPFTNNTTLTNVALAIGFEFYLTY